MRTKHIIKRGSHYHYVCRIPRDLLDHFPSPVIYRTLKTTDPKAARLLAATYEYETQQVFLRLRSAMLPKEIERRIVAAYLSRGADRIEGQATGTGFERLKTKLSPVDRLIDKTMNGADDWNEISSRVARFGGASEEMIADRQIGVLTSEIKMYRDMLKKKKSNLEFSLVPRMADSLRKELGIRIPPSDEKRLAMRLTDAHIQLNEAEIDCINGDWSALRTLRASVEKELATPYHDFQTVLKKYQDNYLVSKPNINPRTMEDLQVACRVLLEIVGNVSIAAVNTMDTMTKLKAVLRKYPKNRVQRYGEKSIHTILRNESGYEVIKPNTANGYIKRLKSILDYAAKAQMLTTPNVATGELFASDTADEEQRSAYSNEDVVRLIDAICTKPLWRYNPAKPERFWIILIALFHGFRLGNIIRLTKEDICQTDKGTWIFRLRTGKTKATVRPVAICDSLLLLGFLEWVASLERSKLFQDSVDSFSKFYNRVDKNPNGKVYTGFEASYVTTDPKKCLYSLRHSYAGSVFEVTEDFKITSDMMGHSTGGKTTARYTKLTKAETLKQITEKMHLECVDLDKLEVRSRELFG